MKRLLFKDQLVERSVELFKNTDEPIYPVIEDIATKKHFYQSYDLGAAAIEALVDTGIYKLADNIKQIMTWMREIEILTAKLVPDHEKVTRSRRIGACILNNYDGYRRPFSLN